MERPHHVALITGAGSGIGKAVAETFAKSGIQILINDIEESGRAVADAVGGRVFACGPLGYGASPAVGSVGVGRLRPYNTWRR